MEADDDEFHNRLAEPVVQVLPETVKSLFKIHDERNSCFAVGLLTGRHVDEHVLFGVGVEECDLYVQHVHLVVQLRRDYEHHADALEPAYGSEGAAAVDAGGFRKPLHDKPTLVGTARLDFEHPPGANNFVSGGK